MSQKFDDIYNRDLQPILVKIDHLRQTAKTYLKIALCILLSIAFIPVAKWLKLTSSFTSDQLKTIAFGLFLLAAVIGFICQLKYSKYKATFKQDLVKKMIETFYAGFQYQSKQYIKEELYRESQLFKKSYTRFRGEDYAFGKMGTADVEFSELHTQYRTVSTSSSGSSKEEWPTIFHGLFFHVDFHRSLTSRIFIYPVIEDSFIGEVFAGALKKSGIDLQTLGQPLKVGHPEFEEKFLVFADSLSLGQDLLTPRIQEGLLLLRKKFFRLPHISFINGRLFIAVQDYAGFFEPHIWSMISKEKVFLFYETIEVLLSLIKDVDDNRLWSARR